jgi:uncharacterized protein (DUF169 family)
VGGVNGTTNTKGERSNTKSMKIVSLCSSGACCPVVKITDTEVEIGEGENTCRLTKTQWETLKEKVLNQEI